MVYEHPGLGVSKANCPHCDELRTFTSYSLYRDQGSAANVGDVTRCIPLTHTYHGASFDCAGQICEGCGGLLFYVGLRREFPSNQFSVKQFADVPSDLKEPIKQAIQLKALAPDAAAAKLRRVLEELCRRAGMRDDDDGAYVDFLLGRSTTTGIMRDCLQRHCRRQGRPARAGYLYDEDDEVCVLALEHLIDEVAKTLKR
jgi:hypothetical protein